MGRTIYRKISANSRPYFEAKVTAAEDFHAAGWYPNTYAAANTTPGLKEAVASALEEFTGQNKENVMAVDEVKNM